jgi:hypothetical protein
MRRITVIAGVVIVAALAIGINRIVVTDGRIDAVVAATPLTNPHGAEFRSETFPLER